ncbi:MAG: hypothetical protein OFPI_39770 [Osedax symbiont Rs2]|nr:MAG: hypothetical protein OFPI_39770 [Osedax symbiont Rs2]
MELVQYSEDLAKWLNLKLDGLTIPSDDTSRAAAACLGMAMEHQIAVFILVNNKQFGSAFSLARCSFEAYVRGTWLSNCATEKQTKLYLKDKLKLTFQEYIDDIEKLEAYSGGVLSTVKKSSWKFFNSLTHTGAHQTSRRNTGESIKPNYNPEEVRELMWFINAISILAGYEVAGMAIDRNKVNAQDFINQMETCAKYS